MKRISLALVRLYLLMELVDVGIAATLAATIHGSLLTVGELYLSLAFGPISATLGVAFLPVPLALRLVGLAISLGLFGLIQFVRWRAKRNAAIAASFSTPTEYQWQPGPLDYPVEMPGPTGMDVSRARAGYPVLYHGHPLDEKPPTDRPVLPRPPA